MPDLMNPNNMQVIDIPGGGSFQFSAVRLDDLGAAEYTLVTVIADVSSSVRPFASDLLKCIKQIVSACKHSPRSENLLLRLLTFNTELEEIHGFKPLSGINPKKYAALRPDGMTALYDAGYSGIAATLEMAERLIDQDFDVNGCVYIITDGMDNASSMTPKMIAKKVKKAMHHEEIESLATVLIGLIEPKDSCSDDVRQALTEFQVEAEIGEFIDAGHATPERLARLAQFVSRSISVRSTALSSGTAATAPVF